MWNLDETSLLNGGRPILWPCLLPMTCVLTRVTLLLFFESIVHLTYKYLIEVKPDYFLLLFPFTKYLFVEGKKCPITIDDKLFKFWHFNRKKRKTLMTHAGVRAIGNADDKRSDKLCKTTLFPFHHTDLKLGIMIGNCWGKSRLISPLSSNQYEFQIAWFFTLFKHCHLHLHYIFYIYCLHLNEHLRSRECSLIMSSIRSLPPSLVPSLSSVSSSSSVSDPGGCSLEGLCRTTLPSQACNQRGPFVRALRPCASR